MTSATSRTFTACGRVTRQLAPIAPPPPLIVRDRDVHPAPGKLRQVERRAPASPLPRRHEGSLPKLLADLGEMLRRHARRYFAASLPGGEAAQGIHRDVVGLRANLEVQAGQHRETS